jgi:restriction system protein
MAIPPYETFMLPVLRSLAGSEPRRRAEIVRAAADAKDIPEEDRQLLVPSGGSTIVQSRAGWALSYLKQADLVRTVSRGVYRITDRGLSVLARNLPHIDNSVLEEFEEFRAFKARSQSSDDEAEAASIAPTRGRRDEGSPEETLEAAYKTFRADLVTQLLDMLRTVEPTRFEKIVVDVLQAMGYGGGRVGAARAIGRSGDGGIDGVIEEDRLGLDTVYVQAKRWESNIGRPIVQGFAGALQGQRARKGVMITTSDYTNDARAYVASLSTRIVLINGERLAEMMIDHNVGVSTEQTYAIKKLDSDYFED